MRSSVFTASKGPGKARERESSPCPMRAPLVHQSGVSLDTDLFSLLLMLFPCSRAEQHISEHQGGWSCPVVAPAGRNPGHPPAGDAARPRAGPQCPLLALPVLPNTTGNPSPVLPRSSWDLFFLAVVLWSVDHQEKKKKFRCFSPQTAVGAMPGYPCAMQARELTKEGVLYLEHLCYPEREKAGEGSLQHHSFLLWKQDHLLHAKAALL